MLKNRKILLTGLTGNVGGAVAMALAPHNEVWGLARFTRPGQKDFWDASGVRTVVGDFGRGEMGALPDDFDYVLNIAANTSAASMMDALRDNAEGVGLLMKHCRKAKAFLHVSTVGVYTPNPDPEHRYRETDPVGSSYNPLYTGSKLAGEGVALAMARVLDLPTVICRLAHQYGVYKDGGLPGILLSMLLEGKPIPLATPDKVLLTLVSDDDIVGFIEPSLAIAGVPAPILNWAGDAPVTARDMIDHMAALAGVQPTYTGTTNAWASLPIDATKRISVTGPCRVPWREGFARLVAHRLASGQKGATR
jgi:nucleoside-diphosphate-sugar epimerase